jgi:hypothetical protein
MQKKTRSLLEELDAMYIQRDQRHVIETRASNVIASVLYACWKKLTQLIQQNRQRISSVNCSTQSISAIQANSPAQ